MKNNTINKKEIEKFSKIAEEWWDPNGKFKPLHKFNPIRIKYIRDTILSEFKIKKEHEPFKGLSILDIGCGIGGPARYMAEKSGGNVCGVDLTGAYIEVGTQLNDLVRLGEKVSLRQGSALSLPYEVSSFDGAYMIHVGMNIERKEDLMREASRVLKAGKKFVLFDVMKISNEDIVYPLPWADQAEESAVDKPEAYEQALNSAGFNILDTQDKGQFAVSFFENMLMKMENSGPKPLGLHLLMGENTRDKVMNAYTQIQEKRLSPILMVAQK